VLLTIDLSVAVVAEAARLGHVIIVLSRRPGRIRDIVQLEKPIDQRAYADPDLEATQKHLWTLMRDEARAADTELLHA
jgi:NitT/TauT family transport system ATP-binding protein